MAFRGVRNYAAGSPDRLEYEEGRSYSSSELERIADTLLHDDEKPPQHHPMILREEGLKIRKRREIYCESGTPDPNLVSGIYWRTHPEGRSVRTDEERTTQGKPKSKGYFK